MPSLIRFVSFLGLLAVVTYAGAFALVSLVEPTQREFVFTVSQDRMGKRIANPAIPKRRTETTVKDRLEAVEPNRLARVLESREIPR